jgi:hypothetical protein
MGDLFGSPSVLVGKRLELICNRLIGHGLGGKEQGFAPPRGRRGGPV